MGACPYDNNIGNLQKNKKKSEENLHILFQTSILTLL